MKTKTCAIVGMSPGNSYFTDEAVRFLLETCISTYDQTIVMIPDIPAIATYRALGYSENKARGKKAIPKGNALRNRCNRVLSGLNAKDSVAILNWEKDIEENDMYKKSYALILDMYHNNDEFRKEIRSATQLVIKNQGKNISNLERAIDIGVHYILAEFAFLECSPTLAGVEKVTYIYHKPWPVYEKYIAGNFDEKKREYLGFNLMEKATI